jgi:hypothetical protein
MTLAELVGRSSETIDMQILRDIPISLSPEQVLEAQEGRLRGGTRRSRMMDKEAQQAVEEAQPLYAPAIAYAELAVQRVEGERVVLSSPNGTGEQVLKVGPHADLLAPAEQILAAVCTIGPALEERVAQLNQEGRTLAAYWLDSVGVLALGEVGENLRCIVEEKARERGWGVGASLGPGSLAGWPLHGQRALCDLLPLAEIGVRLSAHCVLEPHKSASTVVGLGPGYEEHQVGSVCHFCSLADSCWRRRA